MVTRESAENRIMLKESFSSINNMSTESAPDTEESNRYGVRHINRPRRKWRFCNLGSNTILLIIAWEFIAHSSLNLTMHKILQHFHSNLDKEREDGSLSLWMVKGDVSNRLY